MPPPPSTGQLFGGEMMTYIFLHSSFGKFLSWYHSEILGGSDTALHCAQGPRCLRSLQSMPLKTGAVVTHSSTVTRFWELGAY